MIKVIKRLTAWGKKPGILVIALFFVSTHIKTHTENGEIIYKQTFRETSIPTIQCGTTPYFVIKQHSSIAIDWICDSER